jgi:hypothetical protein
MSNMPRGCYRREFPHGQDGAQEAARTVVVGCSDCFGFPFGPSFPRGFTKERGEWVGVPDGDAFLPGVTRVSRNVVGATSSLDPNSAESTWKLQHHACSDKGPHRPPPDLPKAKPRAHTDGGPSRGFSQLFDLREEWSPDGPLSAEEREGSRRIHGRNNQGGGRRDDGRHPPPEGGPSWDYRDHPEGGGGRDRPGYGGRGGRARQHSNAPRSEPDNPFETKSGSAYPRQRYRSQGGGGGGDKSDSDEDANKGRKPHHRPPGGARGRRGDPEDSDDSGSDSRPSTASFDARATRAWDERYHLPDEKDARRAYGDALKINTTVAKNLNALIVKIPVYVGDRNTYPELCKFLSHINALLLRTNMLMRVLFEAGLRTRDVLEQVVGAVRDGSIVRSALDMELKESAGSATFRTYRSFVIRLTQLVMTEARMAAEGVRVRELRQEGSREDCNQFLCRLREACRYLNYFPVEFRVTGKEELMIFANGLRGELLKHKMRKKYIKRKDQGFHVEATPAVCPEDEAAERLAWYSQEAAAQEREIADEMAAQRAGHQSRERGDHPAGEGRDRRSPSPNQRRREGAPDIRLAAATDERRGRLTPRTGDRSRSGSRTPATPRTPAQQPVGTVGTNRAAITGNRRVVPGPRVLEGQPASGPAARICFRCGVAGHIRADCTAPDGPNIREFQRDHRLALAEAVAELELMDEEEEDRLFQLQGVPDSGEEDPEGDLGHPRT